MWLTLVFHRVQCIFLDSLDRRDFLHKSLLGLLSSDQNCCGGTAFLSACPLKWTKSLFVGYINWCVHTPLIDLFMSIYVCYSIPFPIHFPCMLSVLWPTKIQVAARWQAPTFQNLNSILKCWNVAPSINQWKDFVDKSSSQCCWLLVFISPPTKIKLGRALVKTSAT